MFLISLVCVKHFELYNAYDELMKKKNTKFTSSNIPVKTVQACTSVIIYIQSVPSLSREDLPTEIFSEIMELLYDSVFYFFIRLAATRGTSISYFNLILCFGEKVKKN